MSYFDWRSDNLYKLHYCYPFEGEPRSVKRLGLTAGDSLSPHPLSLLPHHLPTSPKFFAHSRSTPLVARFFARLFDLRLGKERKRLLRRLGIARRYDMLGVVGSNLKMVKFFIQHLWMQSFGQVRATMFCLGMCTISIFNSQHAYVARRCKKWPNACNILRPTVLRSVAFNCCDRLTEACKCWANNVGICCVEMLRKSFKKSKGKDLILIELLVCWKRSSRVI